MGSIYAAFGLRIDSEIALPELSEASLDASAPVDVTIRLGIIPPILEGASHVEPFVQAATDALQLEFPEARFLVRAGREVVVQPAPMASERDIRLYLLGSVIGALCHQLGLLPLHANAIDVGGAAIAFAGPSGAGKSTLAAHFYSIGHRVLCDDICVLGFDRAGKPHAWPGVNRIKLWRDALEVLGRDPAGLDRVSDAHEYEKYSLPTSSHSGSMALPLVRVYSLRHAAPSRDGVIRRLSGARAAEAVLGNVYRWELAIAVGSSKDQFENALAVARTTEIFAYDRPPSFHYFGEDTAKLARHMTSETRLATRGLTGCALRVRSGVSKS